MKVHLAFEFNFTFDTWAPLVDGGLGVTWAYDTSATALVTQQGGGMALVTLEPIVIGHQVRNLKDRVGNSILVVGGEEYPMYVNTSDPQFDPYSQLIGWKHSLRRDSPRDFRASLDALTNASL